MPLNVQRARDLLQGFEFQTLFIEELGWSWPTSRKTAAVTVRDVEYRRTPVAQLAGVIAYEIAAPDGRIPDAKTRAEIHKAVAAQVHENLLIFADTTRTQSLWYWVKREAGKSFPRDHLFVKGQPGDLFLSKLAGLVFESNSPPGSSIRWDSWLPNEERGEDEERDDFRVWPGGHRQEGVRDSCE